jgi:hypothetical protein
MRVEGRETSAEWLSLDTLHPTLSPLLSTLVFFRIFTFDRSGLYRAQRKLI